MQIKCPRGNRNKFVQALCIALSSNDVSDKGLFAKVLNSYTNTVRKEFKERAFKSATKRRVPSKPKRAAKNRIGVWQRWDSNPNYKIYAGPSKGSDIIRHARENHIIGKHVDDSYWIALPGRRGYVYMYGWKYKHTIVGTGLAYASVV